MTSPTMDERPIGNARRSECGLTGIVEDPCQREPVWIPETPPEKRLNSFISFPLYSEDKRAAPCEIFLWDTTIRSSVHWCQCAIAKISLTTTSDQVDYVAVSPVQIVSVATSLIPFLNMTITAPLMLNMQWQAVLKPERPFSGKSEAFKKRFRNGIVSQN